MAEEVKTIGGMPAAQKPAEQPLAQGAQSPRPCPQDCAKCPMPQQLFCSVKMLFNLSREQRELKDQMAQMADTIATLQEELKPKEPEEVLLAEPFAE
jgi:hypothetical protein